MKDMVKGETTDSPSCLGETFEERSFPRPEIDITDIIGVEPE